MAKEKAKQVEEPKTPYGELHQVELGDCVWWHDSWDAEPTALALVTAVGSDSISVAILATGYGNFFTREGVRRQGYDDKNMIEASGEGCWSHRPEEGRRREELADLRARVEQLEAALHSVLK